MSGHSKWAQIKRQKEKADIKRGVVFTKLANAIAIAVRQSGGIGEVNQNFRLRLAVDAAKAANMPKENIQRAIQRAVRKEVGELEEVTYEGFAPGGVAIIVRAITDSRNRTTSEVKGIIERNGGTFTAVGSVSWMFEDKGLIVVAKDGKSFDEVFETSVDSGAEDVKESDGLVEVYTKPDELYKVKNFLIEKGLKIQSAELYKTPMTIVKVEDSETAKKVLALIDKLDELDDVIRVYANFDIQDNLLDSLK